MEVTRTNFQEVLKELDDVLENASFLAIDGEFTGLNSGPDPSAFDTPSQYYAKLRAGSMDFLLVQFGLSVFMFNYESEKYIQRSYNFYVFPRPFDRSAPDCRFMCQASCIAFLVNQGFDFNKLFKYGIPYLTKDEEEKLNKKIEEKQRVREEGLDLIPISDDDKPQIEEICSRINDFINLEDEEITIDRCNSFIRRLIYQEVRLRWPNKVGLKSKNDNGNQCIIAYKIGTKEEEEQREAERKEKEKREVQEAVGLSALLRKIADSGKLIVGHNMLLDLCHIINQFFGPLPESYSKFKSLVHCLFPRLLDTKIICQSAQFKDSVPSILNLLLENLHSSPFSIPETLDVNNRSYTLSSKKLHEAGYDAYITGLCFISLYNRLCSLQKPERSAIYADSPLLNPYLNKLLITRLKDYPYINLTGKDPNPSRDHVFHITFPKQWKLSDLSQLFSPYGGAYVSWLSDTTAYAALYRRDQVSAVVQNLLKPHNKQYSMKKYREHQVNLENEKPVKPERKRKISECDSSTNDGPTTPPTTTDGSKSASSNQDEDGWEVASGNDHSKFIPPHNKNEERVLMAGRTSGQMRREEFNETRKIRVKSAAAKSTGLKVASTTRFAILSKLGGNEAKSTASKLVDDTSKATKRSPKKNFGSLPSEKKKHQCEQSVTARRRMSVNCVENHELGNSRRPNRAAIITAADIVKWCTWVNIFRFVGVLVALYFITIL